MTDGDGGGKEARIRFPALDAEPPPMSWTRRLVWMVAVLAVAAGLGGAGWGVSALASPGTSNSDPAVTGRVVVQTSDGTLGLARPGGSSVRLLRGFDAVSEEQGSSPPMVSADGRFIVTANGTIFAVGAKGLTAVASKVRLAPEQNVPFGAGLADHDGALVVATPQGTPTTTINEVSVVPLATGRAMALGTADGMAGDPQELGVFASVPSPVPPPPSTSLTRLTQVDLSVELRDAGQRPVVLATAAQLDHDLSLPRSTPVALFPIPDGSGDRIAVTVMTSDGSKEGVVILDRRGRLITVVPTATGLAFGYSVTWSPDGSSLAFFTSGASTPNAGVDVWALSGGSSVQAMPPGDGDGACRWSPAGTQLLCNVMTPDTGSAWLLVPTNGSSPIQVPALGNPIAWLPAAAVPSS